MCSGSKHKREQDLTGVEHAGATEEKNYAKYSEEQYLEDLASLPGEVTLPNDVYNVQELVRHYIVFVQSALKVAARNETYLVFLL